MLLACECPNLINPLLKKKIKRNSFQVALPMKTQLSTMLALQNKMNTKVNDSWREQGFEWYRAIWTECAELMDHYGWKWWKDQPVDIEQSKLELVDIWHFALSIFLSEQQDEQNIVNNIAGDWHSDASDQHFRDLLEDFTLDVLRSKSFNTQKFCNLLTALDMSFDELYRIYVGKNVLNMFRQDHGYQEGTYKKLWQGREDNEHLVEIADSLDVADAQYQEKLYQGLSDRYQKA
jgi:dimeric dUTPase (all-alpha-NTP-PPase superfamily)